MMNLDGQETDPKSEGEIILLETSFIFITKESGAEASVNNILKKN